MKKLNPVTNKEFKEGDIRDDGYIFLCYRGVKNKKGFFIEDWAHPEVFKRKKIKK